mmetsp:Transcript_23545/g.26127  ORF Transcript_23545/g.26127 Transcript_23545/m.26127 type:complete len:95 (+) Transcript_23545:19-303(+)
MKFVSQFKIDKKSDKNENDLKVEKSFDTNLTLNMKLITPYSIFMRRTWDKRVLAPSHLTKESRLDYSHYQFLKLLKAVKKPFEELDLEEFKGIT